MMRALGLAADFPVMLLDVNNNYNDDADRCILFHCGPAPASLMKGKGTIEEHLMFRKSYGEGTGVGINKGEYLEGKATLGSFKTENGELCAFASEGELTDDEIEACFFGCGKVFKKDNVNAMLNYMSENGYRHHVAITLGNWAQSLKDAFDYLGYKIDII